VAGRRSRLGRVDGVRELEIIRCLDCPWLQAPRAACYRWFVLTVSQSAFIWCLLAELVVGATGFAPLTNVDFDLDGEVRFLVRARHLMAVIGEESERN